MNARLDSVLKYARDNHDALNLISRKRERERLSRKSRKRNATKLGKLSNYLWSRLRFALFDAQNDLETPCGCSVMVLRQHITEQFREGMSWANYGASWEIDHV